MRNATVALLAVALALTLGACRKKQAGENPRCRIFEQEPARADQGTLQQIQEAYGDMVRVQECAKAAAVTVDEFMARHRVRERLDEAGRLLRSSGDSIVEGARQTAEAVKEGAERAMQEAERRTDEQLKQISEMAQ